MPEERRKMDREILSALIGLAGAVGNNGKTEDTDAIVRGALLKEGDNDWVDTIHREKYRISPNCATCPTPCGNTSDYPLEAFDRWPEEQRLLKEQLIEALKSLAAEPPEDSELLYRAIAYIGYDLEAETYRKLLAELREQVNRKH